MNKSELIQHLYDEINRQNNYYMWIVGILVTLIIGFLGFLTYFQQKFSDKQVEKMKENFKKEFKIDDTRVALKNANEKVEELNTLLVSTRKIEESLSNELIATMNNNLVSRAGTLAYINKSMEKNDISNRFFDVWTLLKDLINKNRLQARATVETITYVNTGLQHLLESGKILTDNTNIDLDNTIKYLDKNIEMVIKNVDEKDLGPFTLGRNISKSNLILYSQYMKNVEASMSNNKNE